VERRVHQHAIRAAGGQTSVGDIGHQHIHAVGQSVEPCIASGQIAKRLIDFDQRDFQLWRARHQRQAGRADAGAEIDRMLAGAPISRGGEQDRIMADTMAA
jgi:hypothetical protein